MCYKSSGVCIIAIDRSIIEKLPPPYLQLNLPFLIFASSQEEANKLNHQYDDRVNAEEPLQ